MRTSVYSLKKVLFEGEAKEINCKTAQGEITVLDHHRPLITMLVKGSIKIIDTGEKEHYLNVNSGFLEVNSKNESKLIVEEE